MIHIISLSVIFLPVLIIAIKKRLDYVKRKDFEAERSSYSFTYNWEDYENY